MNGTEIITLLSNNMDGVSNIVTSVAGGIITAIFLRGKTATEEFEKLKAGKLQEVANDLLDSGKMTLTEYYKAKNFLSVAKIADEEFKKDPHTAKTDVYNFDWFIRFYEAVGNISNEEMQKIWAKILAGEIRHPNTYSLRCIDIIKNLSQEEAEIFTKVCSYCLCVGQHSFFPNYEKYMEKVNISFSEIMYLDELGLINSDSMLVRHFPVSKEPSCIFTNHSLLMMIQATNDNVSVFDICQFPLTTVGDEISTLIGDTLTDDSFICIARELNESEDVTFSVHRIIYEQEGLFRYDPADLLM